MNDPRIAKFIAAMEARFPGTKAITGPTPDDPNSGETWIRFLNAPTNPPGQVQKAAHELEEAMWVGEWSMILVGEVNPETTAKYYAHHLKKPKSSPRRRRAAAPRKRRRAVAGRA